MSLNEFEDFSRLPPPGSGDLTAVSSGIDGRGEFTLSGWNPAVGVHIPHEARTGHSLGLVYLGLTLILGAAGGWLVAAEWAPPESWTLVAMLAALALGVQYFEVVVSHANISLGVGFLIAGCLAAGPAAGALMVAAVIGAWAASREVLPWFTRVRAPSTGLRCVKPLYTAVSAGFVYFAAAWLAGRVFELDFPVSEVTLATIGAAVVLTVAVYLLNNLASVLLSLLAGEDVKAHLTIAIPVPALVEFLALPAALLLVVTYQRLGVAAFALLAWLYLMAAFLGWRSWEDRRQVTKRLEDVERLRWVGDSLGSTLEIGDLVIRFRDAIQDLVRFERMVVIMADATEGISQAYAFDRFGARGDLGRDLLDDSKNRTEGLLEEPDGVVYVRDFSAGEGATLRLRLDFLPILVPSERKFMLLETMSQQGATALSNGYLYRLANTDPLTGVASRRYFERALHSVASREPFYSVIMLDLDRFKRINDEYGHPVGDAVLKDLAGVLRGSLRAMDIAGRYGGEEFVIVLPGAASPEATAVAERIRRTLERRTLTVGELDVNYTASFGVADSSELTPDDGAKEVVWRADEALLAAKRSGRNQVITHSSL